MIDILIPAFPGDLPNLPAQLRSIQSTFPTTEISKIHLILITHRRDFSQYPSMEAIISDIIAPAFSIMSTKIAITSYGELFPGSRGHSNSATAKQAALMAFAVGRNSGCDFLVLQNGEGPMRQSEDEFLALNVERGSGHESSSKSEYHDLRMSQAQLLLGLDGVTTNQRLSPSRESFALRNEAVVAMDKMVRGGLYSAALGILDGSVICDLSDLHYVFTSMLESPLYSDHDQLFGIGLAFNPKQTLGPLVTDDLATRVQSEVAHREDFDANLASDVVSKINKFKKGQVTVVQVGANDGDYLDPISPSLESDTWRGLMIEPVPQYFRALTHRYSDCEGIIPLQLAIGQTPGERTIYYVDDNFLTGERNDAPEWMKGIASFSLNHVQRHGVALSSIRDVRVPVARGDDLLKRHLSRPVDLLVIDVEGAEREVLESFDIGENRPSCIIFECEHLGDSDEHAITRLLEETGYIVRWTRPDAVAVNQASSLAWLIEQQP